MKTAEKNAKQVQGTNAKNTNAPRTENRPNITGKEAKQDEPAKDEKPAVAAEVEATQTAEATPDTTVAVDNQPANPAPEQQEQQVAEEPQKEIRYIMPPRNVEQRIKDVENLHRLATQRVNLITRKKQLEAFEVALTQEADELNDNPFQGCKLIIKDDKNREFVTTTPGLIRLVTQFIYDACDNKLAEIEGNIIFPAN
ncbi:hypothetical protein ACFGVS_03145 [Mucilaginibacter sp. AW1-7]|uniref:hypothetical protein n=1 Tax=Mucilaginibacter sp. AW1-7 TaxID=3349874 RepID=UPI003F739E62